MSAEDTVNAIIERASTDADRALDKAIAYTDAAQTAAATVITSLPEIPAPTRPDVDIPPFSNPDEDLSADFNSAYDNAVGEFGPDFATAFAAFLTTHYPSFSGLAAVETWLIDVIENGGTGMNEAVENAIWQRARERESLEASRQKATVTNSWAARGFSFPPGMLAAQIATIDQDVANKVSTHSRDVAIEQAKIEIETVRFAIQQGAALRKSLMDAALDYMRAHMRPWELAIEKAKALVDSKRQLWQSSAAYYNALIDAERLQLQYDELRMTRGIEAGKLYVNQIVSMVEQRVQAAISAADALGSAASAALGSQVSLGQIAHQTIEDGDT